MSDPAERDPRAGGERRAVLIMNDLFMESKIGSVLDALAIPWVAARRNEVIPERLASCTPVVVFVDLAGRGLDGLLAVRFIRTTPEIVGVPVIAFSIHVQPEDLVEARDLGCAEVLTRSDLEERLPELALAYAEPIADPDRAQALHQDLHARWLERARALDAEPS